MNVYIIDDDLMFSQKLKNSFDDYFQSQFPHIHYFMINNQFDQIKIKNIDILFIDIDLKSHNGIDIASQIKKQFPQILIIFISAYEHLVFDSLSVNLFHFIRKRVFEKDITVVFDQIDNYFKSNSQKLLISDNGRKKYVQVHSIEYIMVFGHDILIHTKDYDYHLYSSLNQFKQQLIYKDLIQIQRGVMVNLNYALSVDSKKVVMRDHKEYIVGRKYQKELISKYKEFLLR